jgi:hypothetical protein
MVADLTDDAWDRALDKVAARAYAVEGIDGRGLVRLSRVRNRRVRSGSIRSAKYRLASVQTTSSSSDSDMYKCYRHPMVGQDGVEDGDAPRGHQ